MVHTFESDYGTVKCSYFFDADTNCGSDGIDVSVNGEHVGEIWGTFPDMDEAEEVAKFEEGVNEWLSRNY